VVEKKGRYVRNKEPHVCAPSQSAPEVKAFVAEAKKRALQQPLVSAPEIVDQVCMVIKFASSFLHLIVVLYSAAR
jgi:hypothetical protein